MHLHFRNVNDAFEGLVRGFATGDIPTVKNTSRNGPVMLVEEPVTITYVNPLERVLIHRARDANPFFHLYESLWMLAGRNDVAPLVHYASKVGQYSDDGKTYNGAYGFRWRHSWVFPDDVVDQLPIIADHLKQLPDSRRAVLQMWNVEDDLLKIGGGVPGYSKDVCCNTAVYFSIRRVVVDPRDPVRADDYNVLDMTVTNRSNDMILGMFGANVVHFSFLQEYMAAKIGVEVGKYHQVSNNLHAYEWNWEPLKWLAEYQRDNHSLPRVYDDVKSARIALVNDVRQFDLELPQFVEEHSGKGCTHDKNWKEPFFWSVAEPMLWAFELHKKREYQMALKTCDLIHDTAWRVVATDWIDQRRMKWESKEE